MSEKWALCLAATTCGCLTLLVAGVAITPPIIAQGFDRTGQSIAPAYEGWEKNSDGSYNLVFGYMNRNWEEHIDVPVGLGNSLEPGGPDRGQPTHFLPHRNRFVFRVRVPAEFGNKEVVWTLTSKGQTERAYGTLKQDYFIDKISIMNNWGAGGAAGGMYNIDHNVAPKLRVDGEKNRRVKVGQAVSLTATVTDDGVPKLRTLPPLRPEQISSGTPNSASGLRFAWFVYRGAGNVTFDPPQFKVWEDPRPGGNSPWSPGWVVPPVPPGGKWAVQAAFNQPGTYVLRAQAHDGGLDDIEDVTFVVDP